MKPFWEIENEDDLTDFDTIEPSDNDHLLKVIRVVKYAEILPGEKGEFLDALFEKEGWQLQLVYGTDGGTGYQLFLGKGVQVDNYWEYAFPHLFELEHVIDHAENFYTYRKKLLEEGYTF